MFRTNIRILNFSKNFFEKENIRVNKIRFFYKVFNVLNGDMGLRYLYALYTHQSRYVFLSKGRIRVNRVRFFRKVFNVLNGDIGLHYFYALRMRRSSF